MRKAAQWGERRTDSPENTHGTKHMNSCTFKAHLLPNDTKCVYTFTICWDHVRQEVINTEQHLVVRCFKVDLSLHKYSICEPIIQAAAVLLIDIRSFAVTLLPTLRYDWISMFDIFSLPDSLIVSPCLIFIDPTEAVFMLGWLSCSSYHSTAVTSELQSLQVTERLNPDETCFEISYSSHMEFIKSDSVLKHSEC